MCTEVYFSCTGQIKSDSVLHSQYHHAMLHGSLTEDDDSNKKILLFVKLSFFHLQIMKPKLF